MSQSIAVVDGTGKATVSLGGSCRLRCAHCYITAPQFRFTRNLKVEEVMLALRDAGAFDTVCISGDTDPFLKEQAFCELLQRIVSEIRPANLMFTSRLVPSDATLLIVDAMVSEMRSRGAFLIPCVSFVTASHPNAFEDDRIVPPASERNELMRRYRAMGAPTFAALRPTFPFSLVPTDEIEALISMIGRATSCVLGEVFLLDGDGAIARRLGLAQGGVIETRGPLTFLDQGERWVKRSYPEETEYVRERARREGLPYFLRSMSAVRFLRDNWDFSRNDFGSTLEIPETGCYDHLPP